MKFIFFIFFFSTVCFTAKAQQGNTQINQDRAIDSLLHFKKDITTQQIYKIQVFQSTDPDRAMSEKSKFKSTFNQWKVGIKWSSPNYKVWVGQFSSRLEADRALKVIKTKYNANIIEMK